MTCPNYTEETYKYCLCKYFIAIRSIESNDIYGLVVCVTFYGAGIKRVLPEKRGTMHAAIRDGNKLAQRVQFKLQL